MARIAADDMGRDLLEAQVAALRQGGLTEDEARMVALRRLRAARTPEATDGHTELMVVLALAVAAGAAIKAPTLFGLPWGGADSFYMRNLGFFVLPLLVGYFAWKRALGAGTVIALAGAFVAAAAFANAYPFGERSHTLILTVLHLPIALWLAVGVAYAGSRWRDPAARMEFVRFSGELFIYYVLMALGGGVLMMVTLGIFQAIGIDADPVVEWIVPSGAMGALIVAAWLVESKQGLMENMAPLLTRIFTPLFTLALLAFLVTVAWTGRGIDRNALIAFDALLALVLGLLLYSISSRERHEAPGLFDGLLVLLVLCALAADAIALAAIVGRISDMGFTPNRTAVLGFNLILLANLAWSAVLYVRFLRGRGAFASLERWQTAYLPVYSGWAALVVVAFPPLFHFA